MIKSKNGKKDFSERKRNFVFYGVYILLIKDG